MVHPMYTKDTVQAMLHKTHEGDPSWVLICRSSMDRQTINK
jgi:hypothetical protein